MAIACWWVSLVLPMELATSVTMRRTAPSWAYLPRPALVSLKPRPSSRCLSLPASRTEDVHWQPCCASRGEDGVADVGPDCRRADADYQLKRMPAGQAMSLRVDRSRVMGLKVERQRRISLSRHL